MGNGSFPALELVGVRMCAEQSCLSRAFCNTAQSAVQNRQALVHRFAGVLSAMSLNTIDDLQQLLGAESEAVAELRQLFRLAEGYG